MVDYKKNPAPNLIVKINDIVVHNAEDSLNTILWWTVHTRFIGVASTFSISFSGLSSKDVFTNDRITIILDDTVLLKGIIDTVTLSLTNRDDSFVIGGYDFSGWMMSNHALPKDYGDTTDNAVINDIFSQAEDLGWPFFQNGEANVKLAAPFDIRDYKVDVGQSFYDVCSEVSGFNNMYFYVAPNGTFFKTALAGNEEGKVTADINDSNIGSGTIYTPRINPTKIMDFSLPSGARISGDYGANYKALGISSEESHRGVDVVFANSRVVSVYGPIGIVKKVSSSLDYGNYVDVDYGFYVMRYSHFQNVVVRTGNRISRGTYLGVQGDTGVAVGAHCDIRVSQDKTDNPTFIVESLTPISGGSLGAGVTTPLLDINIDNKDFQDIDEIKIVRDITKAKSDVLVYGQVGAASNDPKDSILSLTQMVGGDTIASLLAPKRKGRKSKAIVDVSPNDGRRPDLLNTDNRFRTEATSIKLVSSRPGETFRRRKIINHTAQTQESALRKAERMFDVTAPTFHVTISFSRLVNFEINTLVHFSYDFIDSNFVIRDVVYTKYPNKERTQIKLVLPGRLQ
jgi:hypothetical protein